MGKQLSPAGRAAHEQFPYLRVANVLDGHIDYSDVKTMGFSEAERRVYALRPGDILLNEGQESLFMVGRSAVYEGDGATEHFFQNTLIRFRSGPDVLPEYAQAVFSTWRHRGAFANVAEKTSISHLGAKRFERMLFPLISREEQHRIVEVLDAVTDSERAIEASITKTHAIRQALLHRLDGAEQTTLDSIIDFGPQNGLYKPASSYGDVGAPIVRINSFAGGPSDLTSNLLRVQGSQAEVSRYEVQTGDLLINRVNSIDLVGKSTVVANVSEPTVFESNITRCRLRLDRCIPKFVESWMAGSSVMRYFRRQAKSAISQASINSSDIRSAPFPVMSVARQQAFVDQVAELSDRLAVEEASRHKLQLLRSGLSEHLIRIP